MPCSWFNQYPIIIIINIISKNPGLIYAMFF